MINEAYMNSVGRLPQMMEAIQNAGVPPRFTIEFLKSIGFKGTNDRAFISVLKGIDFLDNTGVPTEKYRAYKNKTDAKKILGNSLRGVYEDVFLADEKAQNASAEKLAGIFGTKTGKGDAVVRKMATTFKALANLADFQNSQKFSPAEDNIEDSKPSPAKDLSPEFHYNIQIHLPVTKDISVYNAIFKSLKEHLL
ncbi:MAG: hypothetical protein UT82_C0005G0032 [Parcubacteria group bacterium GW2011_GWB1_40_14]|nr:MAG: hypothetical protein UT82_C0005G0032 [Parcubacteria group bacterium GW2011_GWB1_40_14]